jgi:hypothetical protein
MGKNAFGDFACFGRRGAADGLDDVGRDFFERPDVQFPADIFDQTVKGILNLNAHAAVKLRELEMT